MADYQGNFMNALQGGFQFGQQIKQKRDQENINQLAGQAYGAPEEQRPQLLGQMAGINAQAAREQEKAFEMSDERRDRTMINMAKLLTSTPAAGRPALWKKMYSTLGRIGLEGLPPDYDDTSAPVIMGAAQSIVKALGGADPSQKMFSQKILDNGNIANTMADGTVVDTGIKADRQMWFRDVAGVEPGVVDKTGKVTPLTNAGDPAPPPAPPLPYAPPRMGEVSDDDPVAARLQAFSDQLKAMNLPPEQQQILMTAFEQKQDVVPTAIPPESAAPQPPTQASSTGGSTGPAAARPAISPAEAERLRMQQEAADRQRQGNAPAGQRFRPDGSLENIPGARVPATGADKPLPVGALKELLAVEDSIGVAERVFRTAAKHLGRIADGKLKINPAMGLAARGRTAFGAANANDVNYNELVADRTQLVNDSLLLNKGVQTEGDAQRAANALMNSEDEASTIRAFQRLVEINKQGMALQNRKAEVVRANYGQGRSQAAERAQTSVDADVDDLLSKYGVQ